MDKEIGHLRRNSRISFRVKRALDILVSCLGLTFLLLPFALVALAIKLDSKGPIFLRQERVGKAGRLFRVYKFRTMLHDPARRGPQPPPKPGDTRITCVGRFLRHFGLDELPQLFNVLRSEMSTVGPRPTLKYQIEQYNDFQRQRLLVKPGITGWALIHGRNLLSWSERIRYDVWYIDNWSLWLDLKIVLRTLWLVLITREGVYGPGGISIPFNLRKGETSEDITNKEKKEV